ncbi:MAG: YfiT family bacillithiol transferase [Bacteroidota bacterium]
MMTRDPQHHLRYPIGTFPESTFVGLDLASCLKSMTTLADRVQQAVAGRSAHDLEKTYREGGWTVRQVVHHIPDSHVNSYIRFKWALTEEQPVIKPYDEGAWAMGSDYQASLAQSLDLLAAIQQKLVHLISGLSPEQLARTFVNPESQATVRLETAVRIYAWHGEHHLAHIGLPFATPSSNQSNA